jgi:hypothetical protein
MNLNKKKEEKEYPELMDNFFLMNKIILFQLF